MDAHGTKDAAVLVALYGDPLTAVFTERRADLRRHAGEISFPGGRQDEPDEDLRDDGAARGRGGDRPAPAGGRRSVGALPPVGTFVTGYRIHPFVGTIERPARAATRRRPRSRSPRVLAARPARRPRDEAPGAQGRADQDAHLHGRRPPGLGRHGADRRSDCCAGAACAPLIRPRRPSRSGRRPGCPTRSTSRRSS